MRRLVISLTRKFCFGVVRNFRFAQLLPPLLTYFWNLCSPLLRYARSVKHRLKNPYFSILFTKTIPIRFKYI